MAEQLVQFKNGSDNLYPVIGRQGMKVVYSVNIEDFDSSSGNGVYQIMYGLINNALYISFDINWIRLQFKVAGGAFYRTQYRVYYGAFATSGWKSVEGYVKTYTVALEANSAVSPFLTYQSVNVSSDIDTFGAIKSIRTHSASTNPTIAKVSPNGTSIHCYGMTAGNINLIVEYG